MAVLALATAIGGGIVRDVLLGYFPPNSLRNVVYVTVVISVTIIVFIMYNSRYRKHAMGPRSRAGYLLADALGLASFTVTGASAGFKLYPELPIFIVLLGTITAVGGRYYPRHVGATDSVRSERRCVRASKYYWRYRLLFNGYF